MNKQEMFEQLKIDRSLEEPITSQLARGLENLVKNINTAERLPSEREIAEKLDISRVTVRNALKKLKENNILKVYGRSGAYVSRKAAAKKLVGIHPMALGAFTDIREKKELKLLLYENMPFQKVFWEGAVAEYNLTGRHANVKIEWVPLDVASEEDYSLEFFERNNIDLFQFSVNRKVKELAAELPQDMVNGFNDNKKYFNNIFLETCDCFKFIAPLNFNMVLTFWNPKLAEKAGLKNVRGRVRNCEINQMVAEAAGRIPASCNAYGHLWDRVAFQGQPLYFSAVGIEFFSRTLKDFENIGFAEKAYILNQKYPLEAIESFNENKLLFLEAAASCAFVYGKIPHDIPWEPCIPRRGNIIPASALGVSIVRNSRNYDESLDFIRFLLTPEMQKFSAQAKLSPPFLREAIPGMLSATEKVKSDVITETAAMYRVHDNNLENERYALHRFIVFDIREELAALCTGKVSAEETAFAINEKWQHKTMRG